MGERGHLVEVFFCLEERTYFIIDIRKGISGSICPPSILGKDWYGGVQRKKGLVWRC